MTRQSQSPARLRQTKPDLTVRVYPGGRGAFDVGMADIIAKFPSGTKWAIQVMKTRNGGGDRNIFKPLKQMNTGSATAVLAQVSPQGVKYISAKTGRPLTPPRKR